MIRKLAPLVFGLLTLVLMLGLSATVYADSASAPAEPNALTRVTSFAFEVLTPIVTLFAMWAAHRAIKYLEHKLGVDVPARIEAQIDAWVDEGIHYAAEKSYQKVKGKTKKLSGPEKLEEAAAFVLAFAQARGWDDWTADKIKSKVEARLGIKRANGGAPAIDAG